MAKTTTELNEAEGILLDIAESVTQRLLRHLKGQALGGAALDQMKLVEQAVSCLELARLK